MAGSRDGTRAGKAAVELRVTGASYQEVAEVLALSSAQEALGLGRTRTGRPPLPPESVEVQRAEASERILPLLAAVMRQSHQPDDPEHLTATRVALASSTATSDSTAWTDRPKSILHTPTAHELETWVATVVAHTSPTVEEADIIDDEPMPLNPDPDPDIDQADHHDPRQDPTQTGLANDEPSAATARPSTRPKSPTSDNSSAQIPIEPLRHIQTHIRSHDINQARWVRRSHRRPIPVAKAATPTSPKPPSRCDVDNKRRPRRPPRPIPDNTRNREGRNDDRPTRPRPTAFTHWTPAAQERALEALRAEPPAPGPRSGAPNPAATADPTTNGPGTTPAPTNTPPPTTDWLTWLLLSGRGTGKTRTGSEYIHRAVTQSRPASPSSAAPPPTSATS